VPTTLNGTKCVVVHVDLRDAEPMAFDFVMNFARDNDLQTVEACLLPTSASSAQATLTPVQPHAMATPVLQLQA
jgi:hypothetical protein